MVFDSIIFDLDGTLWDSAGVVSGAWSEVLADYGISISVDDVKKVMGLQFQQIRRILIPQIPEEESIQIMNRCCQYECEKIREAGGNLFPGVLNTLGTLAMETPLFIVSNCQEGYIEAFLDFYGIRSNFQDYQFAGTVGRSKGENIKLITGRNGLKRPAYVGDTQTDADAAAEAGIPFIYAAYGFGSVKAYDMKIERINDLLEII